MIKVPIKDAYYWSYFQVILTSLRAVGNRVDLDKVREGIKELTPIVASLKEELLTRLDIKNLESPKQLTQAMRRLGYNLPKSNKGNDSCNGKWLVKQDKTDTLIKLLLDYRSTNKLLKDFLIKILRFQKYTCPGAKRYGRLYPQVHLFGAVATGRMSSSCPSEQQIPSEKKNEKFGKLIRSIFLPMDENNKLYSLDWDAQEPRLQVHYSAAIGKNPQGIELAKELRDNPKLNLHKKSYANMYNIDYEDVTADNKNFIKPVNLGLSYGMQSGSLAKELSMPTKVIVTRKGYKIEVAGPQAQEILDQHKETNSYIYDLIDAFKEAIIKKGYIITLDGRKLYKDKYKDYTAISKGIQGGSLDMFCKALLGAWNKGITVVLMIHDELVIEGKLDNAREMKYIMENTHELLVPMVVEVKEGDNWGEMKEVIL